MKITRYSGNDARRVLIGMATDRAVCSRIAANWMPEGLFGSRWENLVGGWCVKYLQKYEKPIGRAVEGLFDSWAERHDGDKEVDLVERFLSVLSDEYDREGTLASDYVLDLAGRHFNSVKMQQLKESLEIELDNGQVEDAQERLLQHRRVELGAGSVVVPSRDFDVWVDAFDSEKMSPLILFPDPLGEWLGQTFCRDSFVSFVGAFGRGKSWWLLDLAFRAVKQRRRVGLFEVGDMSQSQVLRRMGQRAARRPMQNKTVPLPKRFESVEEGPIIEERKMVGLDARTAYRAWKKMDGRERLRLSIHSSGAASAEQLASIVSDWQREGWVPDVVILDYVDLLAPPKGIREKREGVDETWKRLRRLSQELHCCVITATQGDANSYKKEVIDAGNFSDSRTKNDHVTSSIGLNMRDTDKQRGVIRLNWLKRRDEAFLESSQIHVAGCLSIGCPAMVSCKK